MQAQISTSEDFSLAQASLDAGGILQSAEAGQTAFRWAGAPKSFVFLVSGKLSVHFRTTGRQIRWAECRAGEGQDCMPVTAAILSGRTITVRAAAMAPSVWIALPPERLVTLVNTNRSFREALFATHVHRLPTFFARLSSKNTISLDRRVADWLLCQAQSGVVRATHGQIAADLLTAREVVSRSLRGFATKGWIIQTRGCIRLDAPAALSRVSRGRFTLTCGSGGGTASLVKV